MLVFKSTLLVLTVLVAAAISSTANNAVVVFGAGSTFIYPILGKWTVEFRKAHPDIEISYDPVGSGHGIARTLGGSVDFGASDGPLSDLQIQHAPKTVLHMPVVLGAVVPAYNLPGVSQELRFTPAALAGIYLGTITRWNDPELTRANPDVRLPNHNIAVIFRADGSGTTYVWTDYLSKVSSDWNKRVGRGTSVDFPVGVGAQYNEGVRDLLKQKPYSFGYLQSSYAIDGRLQAGRVQNAAGKYIRADTATIAAASAASADNMPADFRISITDPADPNAYPISSYTWLLIPERIENNAKREAICAFLKWTLTDGQKLAAPLHYAPLPETVANRVLKSLNNIH